MLAVAAGKRLYRQTLVADMTVALPVADASYGAVVSAGTFTHGHVGPEAFDELLRVARPGALFVVSINSDAFVKRGFGPALEALGSRIAGLRYREVRNYGDAADPDHRADTAQIASFRKR
jgi:SAM-dependent methyltransferase